MFGKVSEQIDVPPSKLFGGVPNYSKNRPQSANPRGR